MPLRPHALKSATNEHAQHHTPAKSLLQRGLFRVVQFGAVSFASAQLTMSPQTDLVATGQYHHRRWGADLQPGDQRATAKASVSSPIRAACSVSNEGILLTSGRRTEAVGPNDVENKSFQQNTTGTPFSTS